MVAYGPPTFLEFGDEAIASQEAQMMAVGGALGACLPPEADTRFRELLLELLLLTAVSCFSPVASRRSNGESGTFPSKH